MGKRQETREKIEAQIIELGRRHLVTEGAAGLSLRAIARDLGMVSSAVYRYVASRDELLTLLLVDAYSELADAVDEARAAEAPWRERVRTGAPVRRIERLPGQVRIEADGCESEEFDRVVIATHSDQALALLADPSEAEREILGAIPYQANEAVLHTDASLLPHRRAAWSSWNFHLGAEPAGRSTVTYWMNNLQRLRSRTQYLLTLNRAGAIDPAKVLRRFRYDHPVYTAAGVAAQACHAEISGVRGTHYCGAYWGWGFHEDGVVSALRACAGIPQRANPTPGVSEETAPIRPLSSDTSGGEALAA